MRGGRPVWEDTAPAVDLAALGPHDGWDETPDVLVVGGGVIGLATAVFCRRAGLSVLVVEQNPRLAMWASGRAAGGLSPDVHIETDESWRDMARRSLELHRELDAEWDYGMRTMDLIVLPDLVFGRQAHVDPLRLAAAFARNAGAIATGVAVTEIEKDTNLVQTTSGAVTPGAIVCATGRAYPATGDSWVKGHLIATEPADFLVDGILVLDGLLAVQLPDGRFVAGGTQEPDDETPDVDGSKVEVIRDMLVRAVPGASDLAVTHSWCCFRPHNSDGLPIVDKVADNSWMVSGLFTTGLLMAPVVGSTIADWVVSGRAPQGFALFAQRPMKSYRGIVKGVSSRGLREKKDRL